MRCCLGPEVWDSLRKKDGWKTTLLLGKISFQVLFSNFCRVCFITPLKTNEYPLKIDAWKMKFPFNMVPFSGSTFVHFRVVSSWWPPGWRLPKWNSRSGSGRPMKKGHNGHGPNLWCEFRKKNTIEISHHFPWIYVNFMMSLADAYFSLVLAQNSESTPIIFEDIDSTPWSWKFPKLLMGVGTLTHPAKIAPPPKNPRGQKSHLCV